MYDLAPAEIKKVFDQKVEFLLQNLRHPSLRAKNTTRRATSASQSDQRVAFLFHHRRGHIRDAQHHGTSEINYES